MSTRKSWKPTISFLHSYPRLSASFIPKFNFSTISYCSSSHVKESKVFNSYKDTIFTEYRCSREFFCSLSSNVSVPRCWNCNAVTVTKPFLACKCCRSVQPVDSSVDYFQIFGLERVYEIENVNLERKYKDWQKKLHPDLCHTKSEKEKVYAAEQSALVIDAYRTLRTPLLRAIYILQLVDVNLDEEETVSEPELLAEIMEIREAVNDATDGQALKQIQCQVHEKLERWSKSYGDAFKNGKFEDAITSIRRMTYYNRINEEIVKKL